MVLLLYFIRGLLLISLFVWGFVLGPCFFYACLSYEVASESEITPCNKIDKPLVVYRFTGNVMTSITKLRHNDKIITFLRQK